MDVSYEQATEAARLLTEAAMGQTGAGGRVSAAALLSWWNGGSNGHFDLSELWAVDQRHSDAILAVLAYASRSSGTYPTELGVSRQHIEKLIKRWRAGHSRDVMWSHVLEHLAVMTTRIEYACPEAADNLRKARDFIGRARTRVERQEDEVEDAAGRA